MDSTIIAVRIANGTFVPIMDTSSKTRRRLVLTTIRDDQTSAQIDLYRGADEGMENSEYVGSLMIENIDAAPKGAADVALLLGVDESGNLNATATDKNSGEYQSLSVSLESIDQGGYDLPDFELSDEELTLDDLSMDEDELVLDESAASLSLDDVTLEEDLSFDVESDEGSDTLAAGDGLAGLEAFSEEMVSLDESLSDESLSEIDSGGATTLEVPEDAQLGTSETEFAAEVLPDLGDGMVEADLGDEDFTFDDVETEADDNIFDESFEDALSEESSPDAFSLENPTEDTTEFESTLGEASLEGATLEEATLGEDTFLEETQDDLQDGEIFGQEMAAVPDDGAEFANIDSPSDSADLGADYPAGEFDGPGQPLAPRRSNAVVFVGYIVLALAALGVLTYLVFRLLEGPPAPPLQAALPVLLLGFPARRPRAKRRGFGNIGRCRSDSDIL